MEHLIADGPRTKLAQLREVLADLATRHLAPDEGLPSERELMRRHGVSRDTVRKAIDALVVDGVLYRVPGKGTFVARPRLESRLHLASFSQDMLRRGRNPRSVLRGVTLEEPPAAVAETLGLDDSALTYRVERIRLADDQPVALECGWYPQFRVPGLEKLDLSGSLYTVLSEQFGLAIDSAEQTLWGEAAGPYARLLDARPETPLLVFRRIARSGQIPVEYVVSRYRGDRYQLHMSLAV